MSQPTDPDAAAAASDLAAAIARMLLVDHHVHSVLKSEPGLAGLELQLSEASQPPRPGESRLDSQLGYAVRRWCSPVLGLAPAATMGTYAERRAELGTAEVNRRLLQASGVGTYLLDPLPGADLATSAQLAGWSGRPVHRIIRLEALAESVIRNGTSAAVYQDDVEAALAAAAPGAAGFKSIAAYRCGLDFDPRPPDRRQVRAAVDRWLTGNDAGTRPRATDPVIIRHLLWTALGLARPLQFHTGFGDPDVDLRTANPLLLRRFIDLAQPAGTPIMLLHSYPYQRECGVLAHLYPNVYFDVGLAVNYTGARSAAIIAEALELAPFGKLLFSSDAYGPAELHYLGAHLWRRGMVRVLGEFVDSDEWTEAQAIHVAKLIGCGNACRVYGLEPDSREE